MSLPFFNSIYNRGLGNNINVFRWIEYSISAAIMHVMIGQLIDWTPFYLGFIPHLFVWSVLACYFFQGVSRGDPPGFVWVIIFILFFIDLTFAVNQYLQFLQVPGWRGFAKGEFWYIILSVSAKQLLAWINYGGSRRFSD
eukprot:gene20782-27606_t